MSEQKSKIKREIWAWIKAGVFAYVFVTLGWQSMYVPTGSMEPTIEPGDALIVSKFPYGYTRYSPPFNPPVGDGHMFKGNPERGDIIVFYDPASEIGNLTKRVIGLPGDDVQMRSGRLYINDKIVRREKIRSLTYVDYGGVHRSVTEYDEYLPGGVIHRIYEASDHASYDNSMVYRVPEGSYFVMGDNRDNSMDSRGQLGAIEQRYIFGRVEMTSISLSDCVDEKGIKCTFGQPLSRYFEALQ